MVVYMMQIITCLIFALTCLNCWADTHSENVATSLGVPVQGRVLYPDGSPAAGAKVIAISACSDSSFHFVVEAASDSDGLFTIKSFDPQCNRIRFSAEKRDMFWLKTGSDFSYPHGNGTTPEVEVSNNIPPEPVVIKLELQGAELEISVWDEATEHAIYAEMNVNCIDKKCWILDIATGNKGEAHRIFVARHRYKIQLKSFLCGDKTYFAKDGPSITVDADEVKRKPVVLKVNTRLIPTKSSYDNPGAEFCRQ
jgi:hypothetical protein